VRAVVAESAQAACARTARRPCDLSTPPGRSFRRRARAAQTASVERPSGTCVQEARYAAGNSAVDAVIAGAAGSRPGSAPSGRFDQRVAGGGLEALIGGAANDGDTDRGCLIRWEEGQA
jgi:hypothetical protein